MKVLLQAVLDLLVNLSFDKDMRDQMVQFAMLSKLSELMKISEFKGMCAEAGASGCSRVADSAIAVMYHISVDEKNRQSFAYGDILPKVPVFCSCVGVVVT